MESLPFIPQYLEPASPFLLFANILLGMLMMVAMHCLVTAVRTREKSYLYLGLFFIGALTNTIGNLYVYFFVSTIEPYIGSWLMMFSFILFIKHYLSLPPRRIRSIARNAALLICGVLFFASILHNLLYGRGDTLFIFAMDIVTALMLVSLMGYLLVCAAQGNIRGVSLFIFELTIVVGGISALGIVKTLVLNLNLFPLEVLQGNLIFIAGMVLNGFLFSNLLSRDLEQLKLENAMAEAKAWELKELDRAKSEFLTNISHEFRTPLTVIDGITRNLRKRKWGDSITANSPRFDIIDRNSARLLKQVNSLLQLATLEKRRFTLKPAFIDITKALRMLAGEFESLASQWSLSIDVHSEKGLKLTADPELLHTALINLMSNAIKFSPSGGIIEIGTFSGEVEVGVYVSDPGIGIPDEEQSLIFNRFQQAHNGNTSLSRGTGIGLSLVKEIMKQHEGRVEVQSRVGEGSRFTLFFPRSYPRCPALLTVSELPRSDLVSIYTKELEPWRVSRRGNGESVPEQQTHLLIVEDSADLSELLTAELEPFYTLTVCANGEEARERIQESPPDIILSDIMMPKMDGYALLESLQSDAATRHIPIIFLTARNSIEEKIIALKHGAIDYIEKPFSAEMLRAKIDVITKSTVKSRVQYRNRLKSEVTRLIDSFPAIPSTVPTSIQAGREFAAICMRLNLTHREREIAGLIRKGFSDKEIAAELGISAKTVSNYNTSLFRKFEVSGRNALMAYEFRNPVEKM